MNSRMIIMYLAAAWYLNSIQSMSTQEVQLDLLRRRITLYRGAAELLGRKVIELESRHAVLATANRMS